MNFLELLSVALAVEEVLVGTLLKIVTIRNDHDLDNYDIFGLDR